MFRGVILASAAMALTLAPIAAQAAPQAAARTGAPIEQAEQMRGYGWWLLLLALGLIIVFKSDLFGSDEPASP